MSYTSTNSALQRKTLPPFPFPYQVISSNKPFDSTSSNLYGQWSLNGIQEFQRIRRHFLDSGVFFHNVNQNSASSFPKKTEKNVLQADENIEKNTKDEGLEEELVMSEEWTKRFSKTICKMKKKYHKSKIKSKWKSNKNIA